MRSQIHALVWAEGTAPETVYPNGINAAIAEHLNEQSRFIARTASLDDPEQGITEEVLDWADVLLWWGHVRHDDVLDTTVNRVVTAVCDEGLGFIALHSAHYARPFTHLIGESGDLGAVRWENPGEPEVIEVVAPDHSIADGVEEFALPKTEMFGEPFDIPEPESVVLHSTFPAGGEFRTVVTFSLEEGRGVYIRPGHETFRIYHNSMMRRIVANAAAWAAQ